MRRLFQATAVLGTATIIRMLVGFARAKFTALTLGPDGVGILSQASTFVQFAMTIGSLGIGLGITKYVAQFIAAKDDSSVKDTIAIATGMQILSSAIIVLFGAIFLKSICGLVFSEAAYWPQLLLMVLFIPFAVFMTAIEGVIMGIGEYGTLSKARIAGSLIGLIALVVLIYLRGLEGALVSVAATSFLSFAAALYFLRKKISGSLIPSVRSVARNCRRLFSTIGSKLIQYGGTMLVTSALTWFSILIIRGLIIRKLGADANGFYQVVYAISAMYFPFFTNALWTHFYPRMSGFSKNTEFNEEINKTLRFSLLIFVPSVALLLILKRLVILFIFSKEFLPAESLFFWQLMGDLFLVLTYIFDVSLLARTRLKPYIAINIGFNMLFVGLFLLWQDRLGITAVVIAYLMSRVICSTVNLLYHMKDIRFRFYLRNLTLFLSSALLLVFVGMGPSGPSGLTLRIGAILAFVFLMVTRTERKALFSFVESKFKK